MRFVIIALLSAAAAFGAHGEHLGAAQVPTQAFLPQEEETPAQEETAEAPPELSLQELKRYESPRATMFTFLDAVNKAEGGRPDQLEIAISTFDLSEASFEPGSHHALILARDLWRALNHIRLVTPEELPGVDEVDPANPTFVYFPQPFRPRDEEILNRVDVGDRAIALDLQTDGRWLFSAATVATVGELADVLNPITKRVDVDEDLLEGPNWAREVVPEQLRDTELLGLKYWQWLALVVVIALGWIADLSVRFTLRLMLLRVIGHALEEPDEAALHRAGRATGIFAGALLWLALFDWIGLEGVVYDIALAAVRIFTVLAGSVCGWRLIDLLGAVLLAKAHTSASKVDDVMVPLVTKTLRTLLIAIALIYAAQSLDIDVVPLLTGLGIGGVAFAFAAKDTIENLFGSVTVLFDRPFEVGDWVVLEGVEGTVESVGFRSTRVRTFYNSQVTVANAVLVRATVDNYGRRIYRRWKTTVGVQYDTSPAKLLAFTEGIRELVRQHPYTRKDYYQVWCHDFGASSLDVLVYVFFLVPDWATELRERERLFIDIVQLADQLGVQFAFPTQTLHLYKEEHGEPTRHYEIPRGSSNEDALASGAKAARDLIANQPWQKQKPGPVSYDVYSAERATEAVGGDGDSGAGPA